MIRQRRTLEGEVIPHQIYDMEITHLRNGQLFFPRPTVVEHIIDSRSPLYGIQKSTLEKDRFEIIAILEGAFDHTGFSCHFRTSYLPSELLWGYEFSSCDSTLEGFDYEKFNQVQSSYGKSSWNYADELNHNQNVPDSPMTPPDLFANTNFNREQLRNSMSSNQTNRMKTIHSDTDDERAEVLKQNIPTILIERSNSE